MSGESAVPTRYAVTCPLHGQTFLTKEEYDRQMEQPDNYWMCPRCGSAAAFDDDNYDA